MPVLICALPAGAQEVTTAILGVVQDSTGAVIPGATIRLRNVGTGRTHQASADEAGVFSVPLLPIGTYEVSAEANGFKKSVLTDVTLRVNENRRVVFNMEVGQLTEAVTVVATAVEVNGTVGRNEAALKLLQRTVAIQPDHPSAWINLGVAWEQQSNFRRAEAAYSEALRIQPDSLEARRRLARLRQEP